MGYNKIKSKIKNKQTNKHNNNNNNNNNNLLASSRNGFTGDDMFGSQGWPLFGPPVIFHPHVQHA